MKNYHIKIQGKVQGVFFRASAMRMASELGLKGWVRNEVDGSVEISVEGEEDPLNKLLEWCNKGPDYAHVTKVQHREEGISHFNDFQIIR